MADDPFVSNNHQPPHIYRPIPRRNFTTSTQPSSNDSPDPFVQSTPPPISPNVNARNPSASDFLAQINARLLRSNRSTSNGHLYEGMGDGGNGTPLPKNKSFLNLTGSTLLGIFDDVGSSTAGERSETDTPWGTGAETPARPSLDSGMSFGAWENGTGSLDAGLTHKHRARRGTFEVKPEGQRSRHELSRPRRQGLWKYTVVAGKFSALFAFGLAYGIIVSHLHDTRELAPVRTRGVDRGNWLYLASWGLAGVVLGSLLPYVDLVWDGSTREQKVGEDEVEVSGKASESGFAEQWNGIVRSVGAFMGIAFAIRRLPWQSTLQLTVTLALVNPALWYLLDRSKPGLSFSLIVTSLLTSFIFLSNPDVLPSPALPATTNSTHLPSSARQAASTHQEELFAGVVSYDTLAVVTWVGSVLFCSCVCFGSIGRRLAVLDEWR